ncbi:MAG: ankyrin repeat domain-containing protein, partial [Lentisphaeraceae bacterium]|nr:ankyrin repeat domain-containing protein [Lentisphaeraceae bacterium]
MNIDQIVEQIKNNAEDVLNIPAKILNSYDRNGISLLSHTIEERNFNLFVSLINQGANTNDIVQDEKGFTALHQISCAEDFDDMTEYINCLKSKGHDFNIQDSEGKTALFYAIDYSNLSNVKALVDSGIDVNIKDNKKFTAIMYDA